MRTPLDLARPHRQERRSTIERLNLGLLVDTEHEGSVRRAHIEANDISYLLNEQWILGELEGLAAMRLQGEGAPDTTDIALAQAATLSHRTRAPMGSVLRGRFQSQGNHLLHIRVTNLPRRSRPGLVEKAVYTLGRE